MSCKALGIALKLTFEGNNQFIFPQTYLFVLVVASAVVTQVRCAAALPPGWSAGMGCALPAGLLASATCSSNAEHISLAAMSPHLAPSRPPALAPAPRR